MQALRERTLDLSIIIPVYNLERWIQPMLDSLKAQDTGGYSVEILFVLNNCTDRSEEVIRSSGLDCRILYCTTQGCGPARNAGLEEARGEYIWTFDGDDWLMTDTAVRDVMDKVRAEDLDILRVPFCHEKYRGEYFSMTCQYVMRWEFIKEFRFPNYQPAEDDAYMHQVLAKAGKNHWNYFSLPSIDKELYYYNYGREGSNMWRYMRGEKI